MNKAQLVDAVADNSGLPKIVSRQVVDAFIDVTTDVLNTHERLALIGFGSFSLTERKSRLGRNPSTGAEIAIPAKNIVKFKPGSDLLGQLQ